MERELLDVALEAAREAAAVHRDRLGSVPTEAWDEKGVADFVSDVDREAEDRILEILHRRCPDHAVLAEESAEGVDAPLDAEWVWVVDPLDGTTNYLHRFPAYAVSIAVAHQRELVAGAVIDSGRGIEWTAAQGNGAREDGNPIHASTITTPKLALVGTGCPFKRPDLLPDYLKQFAAVLRSTAGVRRAGSAALDLCWLASGRLDAFWELWLASWDIAAGTLIAREAGATITTLDGNPDILSAGTDGIPILGGNAAMYDELRRILESSS